MKYADTISQKEKEKIWDLYFNEMFTYDALIAYFNEKYTYSQLKSIILERLKDGNTK